MIFDPNYIIVNIEDNEGNAVKFVIVILYQENGHRNFIRLGEN